MDEDWDNLVILDGCRYDMFERLNTLEGELEPRRSLGSATDEFVEKNFGTETFHDTVYVTANPRVSLNVETDQFHDTVSVWDEGWDDDLQTVPPGTMADKCLEAHERYPNKRIIGHFIQPHTPFIGPTARKTMGVISTFTDHTDFDTDRTAGSDRRNVWTRLREGDLSLEQVRQAYDENLEVTLDELRRFVDAVDEPTVVTSDHGNMLGERAWPFPIRMYGHPVGIHTDELVRVPWLRIEGSRRKEIDSDPTISSTARSDREVDPDVEEKLRDLGYA
jgi:hypothetical protein